MREFMEIVRDYREEFSAFATFIVVLCFIFVSYKIYNN